MKSYCSVCKQPLANKNNAVCDKCGKPTVPVGFFDRYESDNCLDRSDKKLLEFIGIINIAACVLSLIEMIILIVSFSSAKNALVSSMEMGAIQQTAENMAIYKSYMSMYTILIVVGVIVAIEQLVSGVLGVMLFLKRVWAVHIAKVLYIVNVVINFLSGNIISGVLVIVLIVKLNSILDKMDGGNQYYVVSSAKAKAQAELEADATKWRCKSCGFINHIATSECKSCGKWKN